VYEEVAQAYLAGLEMRPKDEDLSHIASVASFFVSRIDTKVDNAIDERLKNGGDDKLAALRGKVAVANAKLAYQQYKRLFSGPRWEALAKRGARPQRLLWASTGTKNKAYSDVLYVDSMIGQNTVNTVPQETLEAFRDHGTPQLTIEQDVGEADEVLSTLQRSGISLDAITTELVDEGVQLFADAADKLYGTLADKRAKFISELLTVDFRLGAAEDEVAAEIKKRTTSGDSRRLWSKDKSLWTGADENKWLGWLDIVEREAADAQTYQSFQRWVKDSGFTSAVLLGMGGSSLGAEVMNQVFASQSGWPKLHVLDSTDPDQIRGVENAIDIARTVFIVSSKSGTTLEPNILMDYFFAKSGARAGKRFIAITDPGSALEKAARAKGFAHSFHGDPEIGGRYSVLSKFGLIPAAAIGVNIEQFCAATQDFVRASDSSVPPSSNPGVKLGIALGVLATAFKRDKITIVASPEFASVGLWLEQLIAESTGKAGKGLIPIDNEPLADPSTYGSDRVFVPVGLRSSDANASKLDALAEAGHPIIRIQLNDKYQLGQAFFLCEMAIAMAGAVIGINPFDQPDVEAAKVKARELTDAYERNGSAPEERPVFSQDGIAVFADGDNAAALRGTNTLAQAMKAHLGRLGTGDYFALLAFLERTEQSVQALQQARVSVRNKKHVATCLEFGPRYLHSTGQAHKGGPNSGVFVEITCDHSADLNIPGRKATFGVVEKAQALGDLAVLNERGRRALRVHLTNPASGLAALRDAIEEALS
jgi:transaldolase / glucose-6-phosphate isomerase